MATRRLPDQPATSPQVPEQPPEEVLDLLRLLGVAMNSAGDSTDRIALILGDVAKTFAAAGVKFFVLPTGVFVRIQVGETSRVDFAPGSPTTLRLDQIDALYRLIDDIRRATLSVGAARARLDEVMASTPRFAVPVRLLGSGLLTVGLGLVLNPSAAALPVFFVLGLLVGVLGIWAQRNWVVSVVHPVLAAFAVTSAAFALAAAWLSIPPLTLVIPALVTLLPGAALTMGMVELSAGSMISGSTRLVYGLERLLLLTFGIVIGANLVGMPDEVAAPEHLGAWAPWLGVLVFGVGQFLGSSVRVQTYLWLQLVLVVAFAVQSAAGLVLGSLGASFVAGAVVLPVAYAVQVRRSGPPVPVTFLPAFWLLVPGALGLQGVAEIVGVDAVTGIADFLEALLTIVAIAAGVLVGAGLSARIGRTTTSWRGL